MRVMSLRGPLSLTVGFALSCVPWIILWAAISGLIKADLEALSWALLLIGALAFAVAVPTISVALLTLPGKSPFWRFLVALLLFSLPSILFQSVNYSTSVVWLFIPRQLLGQASRLDLIVISAWTTLAVCGLQGGLLYLCYKRSVLCALGGALVLAIVGIGAIAFRMGQL